MDTVPEVVQLLLDGGAEVQHCVCLIIMACRTEVVQLLLDKGPQVDLQHHDGNSALINDSL